VKSALEIAAAVRGGQSALVAVEESLTAIRARNEELNVFLYVDEDGARAAAARVDEQVRRGEDPGLLAGVPIALKDNLCTTGIPTTCSSKILEGWKPPYNATVVDRLVAQGAISMGKTNLDEFAMGSSTENSAFGPTRNPLDPARVPGGSSGGSAAAVASNMTPISLGSDTGGSIRQPAALCGLVGVKPTYGLVSRYGLIAFASSLDQIGPFAQSVSDAALLLEAIAGHDPLDSTSLPEPTPSLLAHVADGVAGKRIGLVRELVDGADEDVVRAVNKAVETLKNKKQYYALLTPQRKVTTLADVILEQIEKGELVEVKPGDNTEAAL
jgi:aspartyl-tRNA(Asn)/glutamyl-tRNA(Gln) amidotransferase subunit A